MCSSVGSARSFGDKSVGFGDVVLADRGDARLVFNHSLEVVNHFLLGDNEAAVLMSQLIESLVIFVSHRGWTVVLFNLFKSFLFGSLDGPVDLAGHLVLLKLGGLIVRRRGQAIGNSLLQKSRALLLQLETAGRLILQFFVISAGLRRLFIPLGLFSKGSDTVEFVDRMFLFGEEVAAGLILTGSGVVLDVLDEFAHDVSLARLHNFEARVLRQHKGVELDELVTLDTPVVCVSVR